MTEKEVSKKGQKTLFDAVLGGISELGSYRIDTPEHEQDPKEAFKRFLWGATKAGGKTYIKESIKEYLEEEEEY